MRDHVTLPEPDPDAGETTARRRRWLLLAAFVETLLIIVGLTWLVTGRDSTASGVRREGLACAARAGQDGACDRAGRDAAVRGGLTA